MALSSFASIEHSNLSRIPTKTRNVVLNPFERRNLTQYPQVTRSVMRSLCGQFGMSEETENPQPVVHRHHHDATARERKPIENWVQAIPALGATALIRAAMQENYDRFGTRRSNVRSPDVESQTIFRADFCEIAVPSAISLRTWRSELPRLA
jgi:hypothetical protein